MMILNDMPEVSKDRFYAAAMRQLVKVYGFTIDAADLYASRYGVCVPDGRDSPAMFAKSVAAHVRGVRHG